MHFIIKVLILFLYTNAPTTGHQIADRVAYSPSYTRLNKRSLATLRTKNLAAKTGATDQLSDIKRMIRHLPGSGKISKKESGLGHTYFKDEHGSIIRAYTGTEKKDVLGAGLNGKVKYVEHVDLETGHVEPLVKKTVNQEAEGGGGIGKIDNTLEKEGLITRQVDPDLYHGFVKTKSGTPGIAGKEHLFLKKLDGDNLNGYLHTKALAATEKADILKDSYEQTHALMNTLHRKHGIIHGDVHAGNIWREKGGQIRLIDYGRAHSLPKKADGNFEETRHYDGGNIYLDKAHMQHSFALQAKEHLGESHLLTKQFQAEAHMNFDKAKAIRKKILPSQSLQQDDQYDYQYKYFQNDFNGKHLQNDFNGGGINKDKAFLAAGIVGTGVGIAGLASRGNGNYGDDG